ncbi:MAG TPA: hypothetical protein VFR86_19195 [Burkholderiaceae bacterium]|nr:hypothetical protein [Burkholderiaceae bacterium]
MANRGTKWLAPEDEATKALEPGTNDARKAMRKGTARSAMFLPIERPFGQRVVAAVVSSICLIRTMNRTMTPARHWVRCQVAPAVARV